MDAKGDMTPEVAGDVVVGYDGSRAAGEAVRWAADLALELGVPLHVVRSWNITRAPKPKSMQPGYVPPLEEFAAGVELTDNRNVVLHMIRMARVGVDLINNLANQDSFVRAVHVTPPRSSRSTIHSCTSPASVGAVHVPVANA